MLVYFEDKIYMHAIYAISPLAMFQINVPAHIKLLQ